jgi:hypothetical protein
MRAREGVLRSEVFGDELDKLYPIVEDGQPIAEVGHDPRMGTYL